MKRNQILIISGILIIGLLIGVVFWMQFTEGSIDSDKSKITFTIHNSEPIAKDKTELRDLILTPLLKTIIVNGSMVIPSIILLKTDNGTNSDVTNSFSIPLYGMNYIRYAYIGTDMYSYEDRKNDEESFFKSWSNTSDLEASLLKGNGDEKEFPTIEEVNGTDTFIVSSSIKMGNKVWPDVTSLRNHLDAMLISGTLKGKQNIHIFVFKGTIQKKDTDNDGILNENDSCPDSAGPINNKGCPIEKDDDNDNIPNSKDKCPTIKGEKDCDGCKCPPKPPCGDDKDFDGICDKIDKCPNEFGFNNYNGCPVPDSDSDGFNDEIDNCKDLKGTLNGCPLMLTHNNKDGTFTVNGLENINNYNVYLIIKQSNGLIVKHNFSGYSCPYKEEANKIISLLNDPVDLTITVIVEDKKGIELKRDTFKNLSMICFSDKRCGFVDLDRIK